MAVYLVTGGAGFIGSNIVDELLRRGEAVRVLDNLSSGRATNLAGVRGRIAFCEADISHPEQIRPCFEGADYVIHEAALASVSASLADPLTTNAVNIQGTLNVLTAAREARVRRVVFASSCAVYGDNPALPLAEGHELRPLSPYAVTKLAGELYCQLFARICGLEAVALRYFNVFGPRQRADSPYSGVLAVFIAAYLRGKAPTVFGDGEQSRDFVYVADVVDATLGACTASGVSGRVFNVGTGESHTLNQIVVLLNGIFDRQETPRYEPPREGDLRHSRADISLARQTLRYEPRVGLETGLGLTVEWYRTAGA